CDDYIISPFPLPVFRQKVIALIKRSKGLVRSNALTSGTLTLNPNNGIVISDNEEITLTATDSDCQ
ncbi:MAG: DNA-binding response regulator, partial [Clostridiales bacterium]|nr:DNA-binding response regulator [Clostridiales bacterium]